MKRAVVLGLCLLGSVWLRAFDVQYGSLFKITGIGLEKGRPVLPLSRGKYANVRVLDKSTFDLLKTCAPACKQESAAGEVRLQEVRAAKTRPGMWIADVAVDGKWLLTFLVFQQKDGFSFIVPQDVVVQDEAWLTRVKTQLQAHILAEKKG